MWSNVPDFLRLIPEILSSRHIENHICVCYNADRQKDNTSPLRTTTKSPGAPNTEAFLFPFLEW